ncbi:MULTISPECIES: ParB/RepB/Spo0J family partition protein [unclassified Sphingobium]|uniref:ParB/RepB/Spo0J family partition protein n=1 Tax=unclassified Sphingobium TaxID=2611147 RepID=UPI001918FF97|nr:MULTISPECIES: ParB/RepB/Spo0J family partition protein [unclassified Sphingobium]CAD7336118.1 Nucleoid occlusion protein [Sphingobium sp. S6]CAD7336183.1 Nucleoid occlusion protein [Sphingobium sp. S8]
MSVTTMTIGDLCVSPYNCRTNEHDANAVVGMAESLLKRGQLYPLVVHPMPSSKGKKRQYGALAGGRRLRAFTMLVTEGKLPADHSIDVIVRDITDEGELRELSLAENLVRVDLRPYEVYAAVARAHTKGRSLQEIAETNGQTIETVRGWARLGGLHPTIFAALEAGQISQEQARAFGATEHQDLQLKVFEQLSSTTSSSPTMIRKLLKVGDSELTKLLRFVGEKAYADAGGRYELDLFADQADERGRVEDEALLMQLAEAKLEKTRTLLRNQVANHTPGRVLRFEARPPRDAEFGGSARSLEISVEPAVVSAEDAERADYIQNEIRELVSRAEHLLADETLDQAAKADGIAALDCVFEPLEAEEAAIDLRRSLALPAGDIFATLEIEQDGSLEQRFWWASRKAKREAEKPAVPAKPVSAGPIAKPEANAAARALMPKPGPGGLALDNSYGYGERQKADAAIKDQYGLTADGVQVMRTLRREVLRCGLLDDAEQGGTFGRDYAVWCLLRFELTDGYGFQLGARRLAGGYDAQVGPLAEPYVKRSIAGMRWEKERTQLRDHTSMILKDLPVAFTAFHNETSVWKDKAAAFLAGLMLERSLNAPGYQVPLHDLLAAGVQLRDADLRTYAEPTEELIDLLPKAQRLALAEPHVDEMAFGTWSKLKASELTAPVTRALRKAKHWVHPLMRFEPRQKTPAKEEVA